MTTLLEHASQIKALADEIKPLDAVAVLTEALQPRRWIGCWCEQGNADMAGTTPDTYATPDEAREAARRSAFGCIRPVEAWAIPAREEAA